MFLVSVLARLYYRRPLQLDAVLEAQVGRKPVPDIYTTDLPHDRAAGSVDFAAPPHPRLSLELGRVDTDRGKAVCLNNGGENSVSLELGRVDTDRDRSKAVCLNNGEDSVSLELGRGDTDRSGKAVSLNNDGENNVVVVQPATHPHDPPVSKIQYFNEENDRVEANSKRSCTRERQRLSQLQHEDVDYSGSVSGGVINPAFQPTSDDVTGPRSDVTSRRDVDHDDVLQDVQMNTITSAEGDVVNFRRTAEGGVPLGQHGDITADDDERSSHSASEGPEDQNFQRIASDETENIDVRL